MRFLSGIEGGRLICSWRRFSTTLNCSLIALSLNSSAAARIIRMQSFFIFNHHHKFKRGKLRAQKCGPVVESTLKIPTNPIGDSKLAKRNFSEMEICGWFSYQGREEP